ncbi:MAG: tetratricopeptide repeat protein, partial [Phycisphaerae bacterium]
GDKHPDTLVSINNMAAFVSAKDGLDAAEPYYREAFEGFRETLGAEHPFTLQATLNMAGVLHDLEGVVAGFLGGKTNVEVGDDVPAAEVIENVKRIKGLRQAAASVCRQAEAPPNNPLHLASAVEFVLEALHVNDKLSKYTYREGTFYKR